MDVPPFPSSIAFDTVVACNARCPFCPLYGPEAEMTRRRGVMPLDLTSKVLEEVARHRDEVSVIYLNFHGEPLLDPLIAPRMALFARYGVADRIRMLTNGQFLDAERATVLLEAGMGDLMVGFDAASRDVYEQHRVGCSYDTVLANVRHFVAERDRRGAATRVVVQYVRTHQNAHEVDAAWSMWQSILGPQDEFYDTTSRNWATDRLDQGDVVIETMAKAGGEVVPCPLVRESFIVLHDGRVPVCNWDYNGDLVPGAMGDACEQSVAEIWNGPAFTRVRAAHACGDFTDLDRCSRCTMTRRGYAADEHVDAVPTRYGSIRGVPVSIGRTG